MRSFFRCLITALLVASAGAEEYTFHSTRLMNIRRYQPATAVLPDGSAIAAGGRTNRVVVSDLDVTDTIERFDPVSNRWGTVAGRLSVARSGAYAVPLPDGRVLIFGGVDAQYSPLAVTDLYDPSADVVTQTAPMLRLEAATTASLADGRVLIIGESMVQIYTPKTGVWTIGPSPHASRRSHSATRLADGRILIAGGQEVFGGEILTSAEVFDPVSGTWSMVGPLRTARAGQSATLLKDGRVLVAGGFSIWPQFTTHRSSEIYDPTSGTWTDVGVGQMTSARSGHTASLLPSGRVLVTGRDAQSPTCSAEIFDHLSATWSAAGAPVNDRNAYGTVMLGDGRALLIGGLGPFDGKYLDTAEILAPRVGEWSAAPTLPAPRSRHSATPLVDGRILVAGGRESSDVGATATAFFFDPAREVWTTGAPLSAARSGHCAVRLDNGTVLVAGGSDPSGATLNSAEVFQPDTNTWRNVGTLVTPRRLATATKLANGRVLLTGGFNSSSLLATAEIFDPTTETWHSVGTMTTGRWFHCAFLLANGRVFIAGNGDGTTCELFDPATGTSVPTGSLTSTHLYSATAQLPDGRVLISGGGQFSSPSNTEIFDPSVGTWTVVARSPRRDYQGAVALPDGRILFSGGEPAVSGPYPDATRVFDPLAGAWKEAPQRQVSLISHQLVNLPDGRVLAIGGIVPDGSSTNWVIRAECEYFRPVALAAQPSLQALEVGANSALIRWSSARPGRLYRIEQAESSNEAWQATATVTAGNDGLVDFLDALLPRPPKRLYRAVLLP